MGGMTMGKVSRRQISNLLCVAVEPSGTEYFSYNCTHLNKGFTYSLCTVKTIKRKQELTNLPPKERCSVVYP